METKYAVIFGSVQEAGNRWGHVVKEAGRGLDSPMHPVCDGAEWIALQIGEIFGADARALTDFYHVSEYLAAAAPGCGSAAPHAWKRTQHRRLKSGAAGKVIATLGEHREPAEMAEENAPVRAAHRYLSNRADPSTTEPRSKPAYPSAAASSKADTHTSSNRGSNCPEHVMPKPWPNSASCVPATAGTNSGPSLLDFLNLL